MKFITSSCSIGYPVYGAKFLNNHMLLVAGGGGEGNNGIPNKLTVLRIDFAKKKVIKRFREITLDPNDDSPTILDVANDIILMGCNENSTKIKNGEGNHHLRKFLYENEHLKYVAGIDFDRSKQPEDYTKLIYLSRDGSVGAIASSSIPTVIRIIDPKALTEKYEIETGHEVKDMHFAPDGKVISYITASTLEVISIVTGRFIIRKTDFDPNYALSKIKFLTDDVVLITASLKKGPGIVMIKISLRSGSATVLKTKFITNKFKGVTAMDVDLKNELVVLAGSDNSLALVKLKDFSLGRIFKQVHAFAITRVVFSPDSTLVASVSAANTVHVIKVPQHFAQSTSIWSKLWKLLLNFAFIAFVALLTQLSMKYSLHNKAVIFVKEWYEERRNRAVVKSEDSEQITLVGAISTDLTDSTIRSLSVTPTYSLTSSSMTTSSELKEPSAISASAEIFSDEQQSTSSTSWKLSKSHHEPSYGAVNAGSFNSGTTSLPAHDTTISLSYHPEADATDSILATEQPSSLHSVVASTTGAFVSISQEISIPNEISDETAFETSTLKSEASQSAMTSQAQPTSAVSKSKIVTDKEAGLSIETAVTSLSHHGATPKPSDSGEALSRRKYEETKDEAFKGIPNSTDVQIEAPSVGETPEALNLDDSTNSEINVRPSNSKVQTTSGLTTSPINLASSSNRALSSSSGISATSSILHSHESNKKDFTIAATEVKPTLETAKSLSSNARSSPSSISDSSSDHGTNLKVRDTTGGAYPDEVMDGIISITAANSVRDINSDRITEIIESSETSLPAPETATSTKATLSTSVATFETSRTTAGTDLSSQHIPKASTASSSQISSAASRSPGSPSDISSSVGTVAPISSSITDESLAKIGGISASSTSIVKSLSYLSSSNPISAEPSESTPRTSQTTASTSPINFDVRDETANNSSPKHTALVAGTSSQISDSSSSVFSDSRTQEQNMTTPTSCQIFDNSHLEGILPEYGQSLETGSKSHQTHQLTSQSVIPNVLEGKTLMDDSSSPYPISSSQISTGSAEDASLSTSKLTISEVSESVLLGEPDDIQEGLEHDFHPDSVTALTTQAIS